ncbi:ORF46 [Agrotis segetum granulovirus]|uniref:ORF46 n=1 Tax=Agrotis segetum granulosis virus TaxID=10464 RepID=Q6QXK5_GVAS|nr:hypothetical protein AsGV054 [Agrotis segetum granulovirus]AAS82692.1 ORF46 [Agrotis segetum granulovirus]AHN92093.1 hypothetical protein AsGV054 [Agrotis segetum granulovirus]AKN63328.1 hypothetical protein AsGV054 [Agrotis segetum granulovirus]
METVDVKEFTKQLIADRCSMLIESENMLPENVLSIIKRAHKEYKEVPNERNFNNIKELISQTKYIEESVEYKNFNRGIFLIAMNLIVSKCQDVFPHYKPFFANASKRLEKINPDMKSSPKAMLQHYHQCIEEMEHPKPDDHYMISFAKEIVTKIFYDAVADMTNMGGSAVVIAPASSKELVLTKTIENNSNKKKLVSLKSLNEKTSKKGFTVRPVCVFN